MALEVQNNPFTSILIAEAADPEAPGDALPSPGQRRLVVGDDGLFYMLDSTGTATLVGGGSTDLDAIITASSGQDVADALAAAAAPTAGNPFATMADVGGGGIAVVGSHGPGSTGNVTSQTYVEIDTTNLKHTGLAAGTYTVMARLELGSIAGGTERFRAGIAVDGALVDGSAGEASYVSALSATFDQITLFQTVTIAGGGTHTISVMGRVTNAGITASFIAGSSMMTVLG